MQWLILTVCFVANPDACEERRIPIYAAMSPMACMMGAQAEIVAWKEVRAELDVTRWRCSTDRERKVVSTSRDLDGEAAGVGTTSD